MKATFSEKITIKKFWAGHDHVLGDGAILHQNECKLIYHKLGAKYCHVNNFFGKSSFFLQKLQKTGLGALLTIFYGKETSYAKN